VLIVALICAAVAVALLCGLRLWVEGKYRERMYGRWQDVPPRPVAIVLGAGPMVLSPPSWPTVSPPPPISTTPAPFRHCSLAVHAAPVTTSLG
jgi:hypothetical protein